jgi:hypothetical protein
MKKALTHVHEQRLGSVSGEQNHSIGTGQFPVGYSKDIALHQLALKFVRYGCFDTPSEALNFLLEGARHV